MNTDVLSLILQFSVPGVRECAVHLEVFVTVIHPVGEDKTLRNRISSIDIVKVRLGESILRGNNSTHVNPGKWYPLIMSFQ